MATVEEKEVELIFQPFGKRVKVPYNTTILDAAKALMIDVSSICGEKGTCGKCKVRVDAGRENLRDFMAAELRHLSKDEMEAGYRLSCLVRVRGRLVVTIPERSRVGKQRLQMEGIEVPLTPAPLVKKYFVKMPRATLEDTKPDDIRLLDALKEQHGLSNLDFDYDVARNLPFSLRKEGWTATVVVWDGIRILAVEPGDTTDGCFGFACDIGSTKLAGFLVDLNAGKVVEMAARMNPQIPYGEDVMSRISYSMGGLEKLEQLQKAVVGGINEIIEECCTKAGVKMNEIYESSFVGNTCMHHLFFGIPPKHVGLSPYVPSISRGSNVPAYRMHLNVNPQGNVYVAPTMGGFVGADTVADIVATNMLESDEIIFMIDIGTNTEIAIGNKDGVMTASCASGPAFEGMQIKYGMRAATGAIEKISIDPKTLELNYRTIGDAKAVGICGSGLIDAIAEMFKAGIIDSMGRYQKEVMEKTDRLKLVGEGLAYLVAPKEQTAIDTGIIITQDDIKELLKAKAAMHCGGSILMRLAKLSEDDISQLAIAGAFGNYIDPECARIIGMYPEVRLERVRFIGNAAGTGARMMLTSKEARTYAEVIAREVHYYELALDPGFPLEYAKSMYLPYMDLDKYPIAKELLVRLGRVKA